MNSFGFALLTSAVLYLGCAGPAAGDSSREFFSRYASCRDIDDSISRLLCYDHLMDETDSVNPEGFQQQKTLPEEDLHHYVDRDRELTHRQTAYPFDRLSSNDPNFFGYAYPVDDDIGDEAHLEFYISQKYALVDQWFDRYRYTVDENAGERRIRPYRWWVPDRLFFVYNGLFDFYAINSDRYSSSPIISRRQNPGLALEWDFADPRHKFRLGYFHESNGQGLGPEVPESPEADELAQAREEFETQRALYGDDYALAQVSRGWDYWSLRYQKSLRGYLADFDPDWYQLQAELRIYSEEQLFGGNREEAIWWEPGNSARIEDFDGLRLTAERAFGNGSFPLLARLQYNGGVSDVDALSNASWKLSLGIKALNTRFTAFYFNGYGREPSTYHLRTEYLGVGLEFR